MSEKIGSPVVTDFQKANALGEYLTHAHPQSKSSDPEQVTPLLRLRIPFPDPHALSEVRLDEIITFREHYSDERRNLRDELEGLTKEVPTITDPNRLRDYLHDKQARLDEAIKDHRRAFDRLYVRSLPSILQISVPTGVMALASLSHLPGSFLTAVAGIGVASLACAWWAKFREDQVTLKTKPYQYLLTLERNFEYNR